MLINSKFGGIKEMTITLAKSSIARILTIKKISVKSVIGMSKGNKIQNHKQNPYLFVVGCPRSGTTLLQRMLNNHPQLAVANDTHFITKCIMKPKEMINPPLTKELIEKVKGYRRFSRLGLTDVAVIRATEKAKTYAEFVSFLYKEYGNMNGKLLAGEKTPDYVRNLPILHSLFPWAKSIHIIRDGRDVALSTLEWAKGGKGPRRIKLWNKEPVAVCALWWRKNVEFGRIDGVELGAFAYREVKYEDLVTWPDKTIQGLTEFINLPFSTDMVRFYVGKTCNNPKLSAKSAWLPPTTGLRDWRTQMIEKDLELFEAIAGELLSKLGYERAFKTISPKISAVADQCIGWWNSNKGKRKNVGG